MISNLLRKYTTVNVFILLSLVSFISLSMAFIIVLGVSPSTGYEISIYRALPTLSWICVIITVLISISIIILSGIYNNKYWSLGFFSLLLCYIFIYFLPFIRGYVFFSRPARDLFYHIYHINYILDYAHLNKTLIYPMTHIFTVVINSICGLPLKASIFLIGLLFFILYMLSFLLLGKTILNSNRGALFFLAFSTTLIYSSVQQAFYPFFFALCFLPLFVYTYNKKIYTQKWEFNLLILIFIFCIVFFHPVVSIMLMIILGINGINHIRKHNIKYITKINFFTEFELIIISVTMWYLSFRVFQQKVNLVISSLFYSKDTTTVLEYQMDAAYSSGASIFLIIDRFVKLYGPAFVYLLIAFFFVILVFKRWRFNQTKELDRLNIEFLYSLQFLGSIAFGFAQIFGYFVIFEPIRIASFSIFIATILCAIFFYGILENIYTSKKKLMAILMITMIFISSSLGIFSFYESPWKGIPNKQMSLMEIRGFDWYLENNNNSIPLTILFDTLRAYALSKSKADYYEYNIIENHSIPTHFGYQTNDTLLSSFNTQKSYMITSEYMRQAYQAAPINRQSLLPLYLKEDFDKLNEDFSVNKIYINSEFEVWQVI